MNPGASSLRTIDLNADVGEGAGLDERLIPLVTSANIACGGHAGDAATMERAVALAIASGVAVGAHPGLEERETLGRADRTVAPGDARALVERQYAALRKIADRLGARVEHLKLHGALYHLAARDPEVAAAIAECIAGLDPRLIVFGPPGSALLRASAARGLPVAREIFADRRYRADGSLVPRSEPNALIERPEEAVAQVVGILVTGRVPGVDGGACQLLADTVCIHGDQAHAVGFARELRAALRANGIEIRHLRVDR